MFATRVARSRVLLALIVVGGLVGCNRSKDKAGADRNDAPAPAPAPAPGPVPPGPRPPHPDPNQTIPPVKFNFDTSKLGYDPARPDMTIAARQWPRRSSRGDTSLAAYNGKVIATEGRIYGFDGTDRGANSIPLGRVRARFNLFDAGGQVFGDDGKAMAVSTHLADVADWKQLRPGQVVKVVGRGQTPTTPTSVELHDAVVLSVSGEGDPPMTTDQFDDALRKDSKSYAGGLTTDKSVTLTAVVTTAAIPKDPHGPVLFLSYGRGNIRCTITNWDDLEANPPKAGDTVTLVGRADGYAAATNKWQFRGLYVAKK